MVRRKEDVIRLEEHLVVWLYCSFSLCLGYKSTPSDQCSALTEFRRSISWYNPSSKVASWNSDTDCCSWNGITCNLTTGNVIGLNLSTSSLRGKISSKSSLFRLVRLQVLNLDNNDLNSRFPYGFGQLTSLTHLNLSQVRFSGQITEDISLLKNLVSLDLSSSSPGYLKLENLKLRTLVHNMSRLRKLHLDNINMGEDVKNDWCEALSFALPELKVLSLSGSDLSGPITASILKIPYLTHLYLGGTYITEIASEIFDHPNLRVLDMSNNLDGANLYLPEFPDNSVLKHLLFSKTYLSGTLPSTIGNLKSLTKLDLSNCNLSGSIPSSFKHFNQLEYVDLSYNSFYGPLPEFKASSKTLKFVYLSNNKFTGSIPDSYVNKLPNLSVLLLDNNLISGNIPSSLFTLPSLEMLNLNDNQLHGQLQEFLLESSSLQSVDLSNNWLQGSIPTSLFKIPSLESLHLFSNNFSGTLEPELFENLKNLWILTLSDNPSLSIKISVSIPKMPELMYLSFSYCNLSEFPKFATDQYLLALDLSTNRIQGQIPDWVWTNIESYVNLSNNQLSDFERPLPNLSSTTLQTIDLQHNLFQGILPILPDSLKFLSVSDNKFIGKIPPSVCSLSSLIGLDLSNNQMTGTIPSCLAKLSSTLSVLDLRSNKFHGTMPQTFPKECGLEVLNLNDNQLEGRVPRSLANCNSLQVLDLGNNHINDTFPHWLQTITELQVLVLRSNRFHGTLKGPTISTPFSNLHIIDLSNNSFSGNLPPIYFECWNLTRPQHGIVYRSLGGDYYRYSIVVTNKGQELQYAETFISILNVVDLSNNKFEGEIPRSIGRLNSLVALNLSLNSLKGEIPSALTKLTTLQSLDLSQNMLSGKIPPELISLTFLSVLNLSWNSLVGRIPNGAQFDTFLSSSFEGNAGLCGFPLPTRCQDDYALSPAQPYFHAKFEYESEWVFVLMGYGSGMVIGMVIEHFVLYRIGFSLIAFVRMKWKALSKV